MPSTANGAPKISPKPRVVTPVSTELKLEYDTCGYTHGEVHAKESLPELCRLLPEGRAFLIVKSLGNTHDDRQAERQRHEEPVVDGRECELRPRPVNGTGIDV
jgi:hypothetical protein